ncbi:C40 family peptidase [Anaerotignum lactatifermentans]|uniref:C40 family peptidase n=1 Tax=Anaerotignum lactatifermentans TaxID=160404 RepID=A0ABS2G9Y6_9FIRM|nr:C40 family peptidase [Anaerotignum lactatifermentans]MBM6829487.1 C40 family peptidase [Anaerotignum lactatifermentans]MBM6877845.1 C40 family peptidase [Anaerotignum lactatifermentans]MBM6951064.1 C40 family peptidase [Anaerotignum lactatifermentans]
MASPMAVAVMTKKALELAEDKRVRTLLASIVAGIVIVMLIPLLVMVSIFNTQAGFSQEVARIVFDGGPIPTDIDAELSKAMEEMIDAFEELDQTIESLEEEGFDDLKVKSFFYILYFTKEMTDFDEEFYAGFVDCFVGEKEDDEIYEELEEYLSYEFTETEKIEIRNLYLFIKYGYATTDKITGIPGEAFNDETFAKLMQEATKYIGFPYQWGGSTPETSFDCSGFVCWVYTHSGVYNLPRTTAQQIYNQCTPVSKDEVKPGDLVFFTGTYQSSNPVTHIGIYVGDNQMLHCGDPIGYANLGNSYWVKHFYGFGRL